MNKLFNGDCLEIMKEIPDKSIDMVLADPPYGTTNNKWDSCVSIPPLWEQYERIIKDNGAICLFSQMPFGAHLIISNLKHFRYEWIYQKTNAQGFLNAYKMPLRAHENILIFYKKLPTYNPQKTKGEPYFIIRKEGISTSNYGKGKPCFTKNETGERFPLDVIIFSNSNHKSQLHPTQKPVPLLEYLIKTYTNEGETVLDNFMGSGSTGVACVNTNRDFIGIELDKHYFDIATDRINKSKEDK